MLDLLNSSRPKDQCFKMNTTELIIFWELYFKWREAIYG